MAVQSAVPAEIARLRERVGRWRRTRRAQGAMPAELWANAVAVACKCGLHETARGVGVDYRSLAKRMKGEPRELEARGSAGVEFVEWRGVEILGHKAEAGGAVVEMSDAAGRQVKVRMSGGEGVDIAGIVAAFCGAHR